MLVRVALAGATRFSQFQASLGVPRDVLAERLDTLVQAGVLIRRPYKPESGRTRDEYVLTPVGHELSLVLMALGDWANRNRPSTSCRTWSSSRRRPASASGRRRWPVSVPLRRRT